MYSGGSGRVVEISRIDQSSCFTFIVFPKHKGKPTKLKTNEYIKCNASKWSQLL